MGTFMPTKNTVGEEIVDNAITAAINDPRFEPIKEDELKYLEINVDILSDLEDVKSISELDVKKYGIVVTSGFKRGLLLPDIDGVESVEEQIRVAKEKGNINENEDFKIEKFTVERHI